MKMMPRYGLRIGDALYFMVDDGESILVYDLAGRGLSAIEVPNKELEERGIVMMLEDGRLGVAGVEDRRLYLWSWQGAGAGWKECRIIELATLLTLPNTLVSIAVVGFVEGTDTVFLSIDADIFTLKIKSGLVKKVDENGPYSVVIPYTYMKG
ncbi:hypothetical protein EJB05_15355 [Eragrostis curvula]|uniref:F-box associated domain-containing protein n=1 Tax=Eragrostis curvula TaxID=38414 RepID=A0A5J9W1K2_9POAL|nr:hypothetical protein EJB05_15355 [Eragrostis curvula]